ncbi:MAG TPA: hypothetical protein DEG43_16010, partial [Acidimicrobiaceae bacterium]|nr:hypothetical protein [Acidimicrobiaceae bacterium]
PETRNQVVEMLRESDVIERSIAVARQAAVTAVDALAALPQSPGATALDAAARHLVSSVEAAAH